MSMQEILDLFVYVMKKFDMYAPFIMSFKAIFVAALVIFVLRRS